MSSYFTEAFLNSLAEPRLNPCATSFQPRGSEKAFGSSSPQLLGRAGSEVEFYYSNPRASSGLKAYVNSRFCDVSRRDAELLGLLAPRRPLTKHLANRACSYCYSRSTHFCWHPFKDNCNRIVCPLISYKLAVLKNYRKHRAPCKTTLKQNQCNLSVSIAASMSSEESDSTSSSFSSNSERKASLKIDSSANSRESLRQRASLAQEADRQTYEAEFYQKLQECEREYSSKSSGEMMMYMPVSERIANRSRQLSSALVTPKDARFLIAEHKSTGPAFPKDLPTGANEEEMMEVSKKDCEKTISRCVISVYSSSTSSGSEGRSSKSDSFKPQWRNLKNEGRDEITPGSLEGSNSNDGRSQKSSIQSNDGKVNEDFGRTQAEPFECLSNRVKSSSNNHKESLYNRSVSVSENKSTLTPVSTQSLNRVTEELRHALLFLRMHLSGSNVFSAIVSSEKDIVRDSIKSLESSIIQFSVVHQQSEHSSQTNAHLCRAISYLNKLIEVRKDEVITLLGGSCRNFDERRFGLLLNTLDENCSVHESKFHKFNRQRYWKDLNHLCDFFLVCCGRERNDKTLTKILELLRSIDNDCSNSLGQIYINFLSSEMSKDVRRKLLESNGKPLFYLVDFIEYCKLYLKVSLLKLQVQKEKAFRDLNNNVMSSSSYVARDGKPSDVSTIRHSVPATPLANSAKRTQCSEIQSLRPRLFPQLSEKTSMTANDGTSVRSPAQSGKQFASNYGGDAQSDECVKFSADRVEQDDSCKILPEVSAPSYNLEVPSQDQRELNEEKVGRSRYNILVMCKLENSFKNLRIFDYIMDNSSAIVWNKIEKVFAVRADWSSGGVCGNKAFIKDMEDRLIVRREGNDML